MLAAGRDRVRSVLVRAGIVCLVVLLNGCCASYCRTPDNRFLPLRHNLLPDLGQSKATYPLRYDVVYVSEPLGPSRVVRGDNTVIEKAYWIDWYEFFPNGRVQSWGDLSVADPVHFQPRADKFTELGAGYYCVVGNKLSMQFLTPSESFLRICNLDDFSEDATINPDGTLSHYLGDDAVGPPPWWPWTPTVPKYWKYHPRDIGPLTLVPDW